MCSSDLDWSLRIKEKGYKLAYCSDTIIFHKESASTGKNSPLKVYFMNRNRILFARKNFTTLWFFISSIYILSVSMPVNILRFMFQGRDLVEAYLRAMRWNLDHLFIPIRKI